MITFSHVFKEYTLDGELFQALKDISLTIQSGEFVSIVGPSGCGKSTLMHLVGLLDIPSRGNITLFDQDISKLSDNQLSGLRNDFVGFIFQQFNLINKLTVLENILLPTIYHKSISGLDEKKRAIELMDRFGITSKAKSLFAASPKLFSQTRLPSAFSLNK